MPPTDQPFPGLRGMWYDRRQRVFLPGSSVEDSHPRVPCLVHLIRASNDPAFLQSFAAALRRHPPGCDFELVLVMKGFKSPEQAQPCLDELAGFEFETLFLPDVGQDLDVYYAAAAHLRRDRYCFLNSYSVPLVEGWLAKLDAALTQPGTGAVGATGSWFSSRSWVAYLLHLPSPYRHSLPAPRLARRQMLAVQPEQNPSGPGATRATLRARAKTLRILAEQERFPAYHLRTNAFMISHAVLQRVCAYASRGKLDGLLAAEGKLDALLLESSRNSITRQVQRMGLRTLVVDRDGAVFEHERWDRSYTYCQGNQEGLLIADNRTDPYQHSDATARRLLSTLVWGSHADPGPPAPDLRSTDLCSAGARVHPPAASERVPETDAPVDRLLRRG